MRRRGGDGQPGWCGHGVVVGKHPEMSPYVPAASGPLMLRGRPHGVHGTIGRAVTGQKRELQSEHVQGDRVVGKCVAGDVHTATQPGDAPGTNRGLDAPFRHPLGCDVRASERGCRRCPRVRGAHRPTLTAPAADAQGLGAICGQGTGGSWPRRRTATDVGERHASEPRAPNSAPPKLCTPGSSSPFPSRNLTRSIGAFRARFATPPTSHPTRHRYSARAGTGILRPGTGIPPDPAPTAWALPAAHQRIGDLIAGDSADHGEVPAHDELVAGP